MDDERAIDFVLNGEQHRLSRTDVLSAAARGGPEPIRTHWVSIGDQRWPPRQLFERALGVSRTEFISHTAIRQLRRLGFPTSPLPDEREAPDEPEQPTEPLAPRSDLGAAVKSFIDLHEFFGQEALSSRVGRLEALLEGADSETVDARMAPEGLTDDLLKGALLVRQHAGRVNDLIHAAVIVRALPSILEPGERIVRRPSLASGNGGGRKFDLETDRRVVEFKAAEWKGRDTMRKRMLVADLVGLVLERDGRRAELYVLGRQPLDYLRTSTSTVEWALGRSSPNLREAYKQRFGSAELTVSQFTAGPAADVVLRDLNEIIG
ncbi:hypothetical protein [Amycolatopsis sp. SID8362]|uniref:hypothetical protein n=1 Tax=Amycolatopsis sp. SID8362 TaxID=2690346 RepID=UPI001371D2DA|nr:hypothetical protein [Amycolatopsis sp. SID8362]NBH08025.1 hypothetical protein [Amycolatopsis sp. SID8362]NED44719.1 hypothetical protein [Amycolatopsis sp. SID8362]